nr:MBL fold metallo-hydrolase [uncultured Fusobacterium sp.]
MKLFIKFFIVLTFLGIILSLLINLFLKTKAFGKLPSGERLEKIKLSKNYNLEKAEFEYPIPTILLGTSKNKESANKLSAKLKRLYQFATGKDEAENTVPNKPIPSVKTNLFKLDIKENLIVWLGHSSLYLQLEGNRILVDPVLEKAFPLPFAMKAFEGSDIFKSKDIPEIDILILTHDHWDHLNYPTIMGIKNRVKKFIVPLGVGEHLEHWGINKENIIETDWWETISLKELKIHTLPARHFSGRGFIRNKSLWASFLIETKDSKLFFNGDSGYGPHYKEIGEKFKNIDFVAMEAGQYNSDWANIHIHPEEILLALNDLNTQRFLPIHNSKFKLSKHNWYEPLDRLDTLIENTNIHMQTPLIGEIIYLNKKDKFSKWWKSIK